MYKNRQLKYYNIVAVLKCRMHARYLVGIIILYKIKLFSQRQHTCKKFLTLVNQESYVLLLILKKNISGCLKSGLVQISDSSFQELAQTALYIQPFSQFGFRCLGQKKLQPDFGVFRILSIWISEFQCILNVHHLHYFGRHKQR